ncbi:MAG: type II toxin-antitoxin system RelE/ParE family toxin [Phycisphaerales bacterium]|nr:type II toxin-antitoxin system RelE/ParE family toxin [Phycisphaerales bacterium]
MDLDAAYAFVCESSPEHADGLVSRLSDACRSLPDFPGRGRRAAVRGLKGREVRRMLVDPYHVFYLVEVDSVVIIRIWHAARRPPSVQDLRS